MAILAPVGLGLYGRGHIQKAPPHRLHRGRGHGRRGQSSTAGRRLLPVTPPFLLCPSAYPGGQSTMGITQVVVDPEVRRAEEEAAWLALSEPGDPPRVRWRRILDRVHVQCKGPLVLAKIHSQGWQSGWYVFKLPDGVRIENGCGSDREFRIEVWKRILSGEQISGAHRPISAAKLDAAHRVGMSNGAWGS